MRTPKPLPLLAGILLTACGTAPHADHPVSTVATVSPVAMTAATSGEQGEQKHSQFSTSLRDEPITTEDGIVTTAEAAGVDRSLGLDHKHVVELTKGVYILLATARPDAECKTPRCEFEIQPTILVARDVHVRRWKSSSTRLPTASCANPLRRLWSRCIPLFAWQNQRLMSRPGDHFVGGPELTLFRVRLCRNCSLDCLPSAYPPMAIQLIINHELGQAKNENPLQGSFIIEELTDLVEKAVYEVFERISERGGVLGAMETMYQRGKIQEESLHRTRLTLADRTR